MRGVLTILTVLTLAAATTVAQSTTGTIRGTVRDYLGGTVPGAAVTIRNIDTNVTRTVICDGAGHYRLLNVPVGEYELHTEAAGFARYLRSGISLQVDQTAEIDVEIRPAAIAEAVEVRADAPLLNRSNAEVGVRFDRMRVAELPVRSSRSVFALALSAPGVSELASGQTEFAGENRTGFSSNGMRLRSNNWMIDGQDNNDPNANNRLQPINNTDIVQEVRVITNQFAAEFGRSAGSVVNVITRSGTNTLRGSAFIFHNDDQFNARSNLDKSAGRADAPYRVENQSGGTLGGAIIADRTFFFASFQRWIDRRLASGFTLNGAPTQRGREILTAAAGDRPQVQALLKHVPPGNPNGHAATFVLGDETYTVPLGSLTGSAPLGSNNNQLSARIDHQLSPTHAIVGRYLLSDSPRNSGGDVQVTPPGLTSNNPSTRHSLNFWASSLYGSSISHEFRAAWARLSSRSDVDNAAALEIPSIEIPELGMTGSLATRTRTAFGLASNLPSTRDDDHYQLQNTFTFVRGAHVFKGGYDVRAHYVKSFFLPSLRGTLRYPTLDAFIADVAEAASISGPLPGGQEVNYYRWWDQFYFAQDEWRLRRSLTLSVGLRYELPGNSMENLVALNRRIVEANGNDAAFALYPVPARDVNNVEPRFGFNWMPPAGTDGMLGWIFGEDRFVVRGGYARTHDYAFLNIAQNIASSFPFTATATFNNLRDAFVVLQSTVRGLPSGTDPTQLTRTVVAEGFRAPAADQVSLELQRQLSTDLAVRVGYVATFGRDLFQTLDGNPRRPFRTERVNPAEGVVRVRGNTAQSSYHSVQLQVDKRFSHGVSAGAHYTWSRFEDTASDIFNTSVSEVAVAQDSFDLAGERARSTYDRPHRLTGNFVWELPVPTVSRPIVRRLLDGWHVSAFFTVQSGAPFTVLNGADPTGALAGIDALVGSAIRPNLNTNLDVSHMTIEDVRRAGGAALFRALCGNPSPTCAGERVGNAPRNLLRADGIENIDLALVKNTRLANDHVIQLRVEMFNATNTRNFGIPDGRINSASFLNQWATDGGNRRIWLALRYVF
jgi:hypothetical protein